MKKTKMNPFPPNLGLASVLALSMGLSMTTSAFAENGCPGGGMSLSFDLSKTNNPAINSSNTYIVILGIDPATKKHAYVRLEEGQSKGSLVDINNESINGREYGIALSQLLPNTEGKPQACVPHLTSGRVYISFGNALDMPTDKVSLTPKQPDVNNPQTTSNGTLFDKVEFNYSTSGETVINPTGVDFVAIPYTIKQAGHEFGHLGGLDGIIDNMKSIVCKSANEAPNTAACNTRWAQSEWSSLIVYNAENGLMRVDAPGRSGPRFNGYFTNYINQLSGYYSSAINRSIKVDLRELNKGTWTGSFVPSTQNLVFTKEGGDGQEAYAYNMGLPQTSNSILMGAQAPFNNRNAIDATIARDITSAIVSGMLMRKESALAGKNFFDAQGSPVLRNKEQMQTLMPFYFNNGDNSVDYVVNQCGAKSDAPCINVYSEAVHALSFDKNIAHPQESYVNSYAFAYDDFLGMDGTNTQNDSKPAVIVIGDMKGRKVPHI